MNFKVLEYSQMGPSLAPTPSGKYVLITKTKYRIVAGIFIIKNTKNSNG